MPVTCPTCGALLPPDADGLGRCPTCGPASLPELVRPAIRGFRETETGGILTMSWPPIPRLGAVALLALVGVGGGAMATTPAHDPRSALVATVALAFVASMALFSAVNRVEVQLGDGAISIRSRPLPGVRTIPVEGAFQLFVRKVLVGGREGQRYLVVLLRRDRPDEGVVSVSDPRLARYVELRLERALGLPDIRIREEFRG